VAGSFNQQWTSWERALKYLQEGSIQTLPLVSDILPLSQWHEGLAKQESRQATRVLLIPE